MGFLSRRQKMGTAAILLAASAFLSRLMGLIRDKIISWQYGAGSEADMYFAAFVVPDIINYLLAGGFISITIIPVLAECFEKDPDDAWRFFSCVLFWMTSASLFLTIFCIFFAVPLARLLAPGFSPEQLLRLAFFMRIILPGQVFFLTGACFTALLLLRRQFSVPALTPLIYNGCIILAGVLLPYASFGKSQDFGMTGYCIGVSTGAFLGALILPGFIACKKEVKFSLVLWHPKMKQFLFIALPLMLGQTVIMLDEQFLRIFGSMLGEGNVALLNYGRRIAQVPVALLGQALAAASYPFLVNLLAQRQYEKFQHTLNIALDAGLNLVIPCAGLMITAAIPILGAIFLGGRFGLAETYACAPLTQIMLAATPFWILYMVMARAFYATGDTLTPAITGTIVTIICIPCYYFLAVPHGAWGVALVSGLGVASYAIWLVAIWIKRHGNVAFTGLWKRCSASLILTTLTVLVVLAANHIFFAKAGNLWEMILYGALDCACFLAIFCLGGYFCFHDYFLSLKNSLKKRKD